MVFSGLIAVGQGDCGVTGSTPSSETKGERGCRGRVLDAGPIHYAISRPPETITPQGLDDYQKKLVKKEFGVVNREMHEDSIKAALRKPENTVCVLKYKSQKRTMPLLKLPQELGQSMMFEEQKGFLQLPVRECDSVHVKVRSKHPIFPGTYDWKPTFDIYCQQDEPVRAIYEGIVAKVWGMPGNVRQTVMIKNGEYMSVYCNLVEVVVKEGQELKEGDYLGKVMYDKDVNRYILHFELWKGIEKQKPEEWFLATQEQPWEIVKIDSSNQSAFVVIPFHEKENTKLIELVIQDLKNQYPFIDMDVFFFSDRKYAGYIHELRGIDYGLYQEKLIAEYYHQSNKYWVYPLDHEKRKELFAKVRFSY